MFQRGALGVCGDDGQEAGPPDREPRLSLPGKKAGKSVACQPARIGIGSVIVERRAANQMAYVSIKSNDKAGVAVYG